jgi:hypothetical protein
VQVASWRSAFAGIVPPALLGDLTSLEAAAVWRDRWREAIGNPPTSRHRVLTAVTDGVPREVAGFVSGGPATRRSTSSGWHRTGPGRDTAAG